MPISPPTRAQVCPLLRRLTVRSLVLGVSGRLMQFMSTKLTSVMYLYTKREIRVIPDRVERLARKLI